MNPSFGRLARSRASVRALAGLLTAGFWPAVPGFAQAVNPETQPASGFSAMPAIVNVGGSGTVAAYAPPHEQLENPADDADQINDNRTRQNFTRPIYLTPDNLDASGNPVRPVPTTDWWTDVLMNGDGGTLWQYPVTSKFVATGLELLHILGPSIPATPGDYATGFATGGLLRVEAIEQVSALDEPDIILAGFEGAPSALPGGWTITPVATQGASPLINHPVMNLAECPGNDPANFVGERFIITKNLTGDVNAPKGQITSAVFEASRDYLHFKIGGTASPDLRVELLDAGGAILASLTRPAGGSTQQMIWVNLDLRAQAGQSLRFRIVDNHGSAWLGVDQFLLSNEAVAPDLRPGSRVLSGVARVRDWSDWMVKVRKVDDVNPAMAMDVSLVRNMPFAWVELTGATPRLSFATGATVVLRNASGAVLTGANLGVHEKISVETGGRFYGLHVAAGSVFTYDGGTNRLAIAPPIATGSNYLVVSALPSSAALATLDAYAYARPEKTTVAYAYDPASPGGNAVRTTWKYEITPLKPGADKVLQGWLAPHYRDTGADLHLVAGIEYTTPRGLLRCGEAVATGGFAIDYGFNGILATFARPADLGLPDGFDPEYMEQLLRSYDATNDGVAGDTYFGAKNLVKHGRAMHMAKELGLTDVYENLKAELKASLTDWFTYDGAEENHYFAHSERWGHIIGLNYVPDFNLAGFTDVHFHYGYYTLAYALLATEDATFRDQFKDIAVELARAYANWERPTAMRNASGQLQFPWMRTFEPMVGHSYAGGSGGNNQESSSESIQAWAGMFLLGEALRGNDPRAADLMATAAFGYAIETRAVYEYYADYHGSPFASGRRDRDGNPVPITEANRLDTSNGNWPASFRYGRYAQGYPEKPAWIFTNGIMTDGGNSFSNYFSGEPAHTYGIQWLPNAPHMMFLARDPAFIAGQFETLFKYRDEHLAIQTLNPLRTSMKNLRAKWHSAPTAENPDQRVVAIEEGWPTYGMKFAIQTIYELNPAYARQTANNPLYRDGQWLVTFPAADTKDAKIVFPAAIWTPAALIANHPHLVPPATEAGLATSALAQWVEAFAVANGGPGPDWARYKGFHSWDPADYPARDSAASITGLLNAMQDIGGNSWPLIALCYQGFADPEFALKVMAEYRRLGLSYATDTESNMFFYNYLHSLRGLGTIQTDQHLAIGASAVFKDAAGNRSYMVQNKTSSYELVNVFGGGAVIGQVLAYPNTTTLQRGVFAAVPGFAPIGSVPEHGAVNVSVSNSKVVVVFNQPYNASTLDTEVTISGPGGLTLQYVPGPAPQIAEYRVVGDWTLGGTYTITVPGAVANAAGTATVGAPRTFTFTVQGAFGLALTGSNPAAGSSTADPGLDAIELRFNSRIAPATLAGIMLAGDGSPALSYDAAASIGGTVVLRLGSDLRPGGAYTLNIPGTVADVYGQSLGAPASIAFTTRPADSVLSNWETTLAVAAFDQLASSGESTEIVHGGKNWNFDAVGDFVELGIEVEKGGTYNLKTTHRENPGRGKFRLLVNGQAVPDKAWNQTQVDPAGGFNFGPVRLEPGQNILRFEVLEKVNNAQPKFHFIAATFTPVEIDVALVAGPYAESGGLVVFEAEDYMHRANVTVSGVERSWNLTTERPGFAGTGAMRSLPNAGVNLNVVSSVPATGARLDYHVRFTTPGTYKVWVRGDAAGGDADDSVHVGLNGVVAATAKDISMERATSFLWTARRMFVPVTTPAVLVIPEPGVYTINLWMREDGAYVDRLLLAADPAFVPSGVGPAASARLLVSPTSALTAASASGGTTGTAYAQERTVTFAAVGAYDYLFVRDDGGTALNVEYLIEPDDIEGGYVSLDGGTTYDELPPMATPYDVDGDNSDDFYDVFDFDQALLPLPDLSYNVSAQAFTVRYHKGSGGLVHRLHISPDSVTWTPLNMALETFHASSGLHQYVIPWSLSAGTPLFIRMEVSAP